MAVTRTIEKMPPPFNMAATSACSAEKPVTRSRGTVRISVCCTSRQTPSAVTMLAVIAIFTLTFPRDSSKSTTAGSTAQTDSRNSFPNTAARSGTAPLP